MYRVQLETTNSVVWFQSKSTRPAQTGLVVSWKPLYVARRGPELLMNVHLNQYRYIDIKELYTEILCSETDLFMVVI